MCFCYAGIGIIFQAVFYHAAIVTGHFTDDITILFRYAVIIKGTGICPIWIPDNKWIFDCVGIIVFHILKLVVCFCLVSILINIFALVFDILNRKIFTD